MRPGALLCVTTVLLGGLVYLNALHNPFVYDDYRTIVDNASIRTLSDVRSIVQHEVTRPVVNLSYALDVKLWGSEPIGFHVTNVLLHMLNIGLLFLVGYRLSEDRRSSDFRFQTSDFTIAFLAAALFAVHPMMTEAVGYISGRSEVLCATFFFLAFICGRRWMRDGGARWWLLTVGLWAVALLTKEIAAALPMMLFVHDRLMIDDGVRERRRRFLRLHGPLLSVALIAGATRLAVFVMIEHPGEITLQWPVVVEQAVVAWRYAALLIAPTGQAIFHDVRPVNSLWNPWALLTAGATVSLVIVAWRARGIDALTRFGVIWFLLLLLPSSLIVVLDQGEAMAEHRAYLASCGLFLAAGSMVGQVGSLLFGMGRPIRFLAYAALVVGLLSLSARTVLRNAIWSDPVALWREARDQSPRHWLPHTVLAETLDQNGRTGEAEAEFRAALQLRPHEPLAYLKLGLCLAELGRLDEAAAIFDQLRSIDPRSTFVSTGMGVVAMMAGQTDEARARFMASLERDPRDIMARQWLAVLEEESANNPAAALQRCEEIQALAPGKLSNEDCIRRNRARLAEVNAGRR